MLAAVLVVHLWPEWVSNPDLSHGFMVPAASLLLVHLSRRSTGGGSLPAGASGPVTAFLGLAALAALWTGALLAASLDWVSPVVDFSLAVAMALMVGCALAAFADRRSPWIPLGWASVAAALVWALGAPLPPGTYARLTLDLQLWISSSVMHTLGLLGIVARRQGNIIELSQGTVGVEEACSGVRSLVSCVFAGILISAALCHRTRTRILLVVLSAPLALLMNFARSMVLTLLVNAGVRIEGPWHDATGYAILVATAAALFGLALALEPGPGAAKEAPPEEGAPPAPGAPSSQWVLAAVLALAVASLVFFVAGTRSTARGPVRAPDLESFLPAAVPGWEVRTSHDLYRFAGTLRTDLLAQRTYVRAGTDGNTVVILYLAYWLPGQTSVGLVGAHTPDACWPGTGWQAREVADPKVSLMLGGVSLPAAQHRLFTNGSYPQHVWFWQLYNGHTIDIGSTHSIPNLLEAALHYGFRSAGEQLFVRVSCNRPWEEVSREPFVADFFGRLRTLGLY